MIYILDTDLNVLSLLVNAGPDACPYFDDIMKETIAEGAQTYEFTTLGNHEAASHLKSTGYIMRANLRGDLILFKIRSIQERKQADGRIFKTVFCENAALELIHDVVRPLYLYAATPASALTSVLQGTEWRPGTIEWLGQFNFEFSSYPTVLAAIQEINNTTGGEIVFRVELENGRVAGKFVDLLQQRGEQGAFRFDYRHDLQEVERVEDSSFLVTALIGIGQADSGRAPVTMAGIEYTGTLPDGTKVYKSPNQDYIENPQALQRYGTRGRHKFGVFKTEETDRLALIKRAWAELMTYSEPQLEYTVKVAVLSRLSGSDFGHKTYELGDRGDVIDHTFSPSLMVSARIIEREISFTDPSRDSVTLGNFVRYQPTTLEIIERLQDTIRENAPVWNSGGEMIHKGPAPPAFPADMDLWLDTSQEPHILKKYDAAAGGWINASPTEPGHIGAIPPEYADEVAREEGDRAEENAKEYTKDLVDRSEAATRDFIQQNYKAQIIQQKTAPASPSENDLWIDVSTKPHVWKRWDGSEWVNATTTSLDELAGQLKAGQIERGAVTADLLAEGAVTANKIMDDAITAAKIAAAAVTNEKIAGIDAGKITTGRLDAGRVQIGAGTEFAKGYDPTTINIGGRNLAQRTNTMAWTSYYSSNVTFLQENGQLSINVGYLSGSMWGVQQTGAAARSMKLEAGKEYTFSYEVRGTPGLEMNYTYVMNPGTSNEMVSMTGPPLQENAFVKYTGTFTKKFEAASSYIMIGNRNGGAAGAFFEIRNVKIEAGNKATDWQPSPEDTSAEITTAIQPVNDRLTLWAYEDTTFIDGGSIYANSITANQLAAGSIEAEQIAAGAITAEKIAAGAFTADNIAAGSITSTMIAAQGLDAGVIKFGTMSGARIMTNSLDANVLKSGTVIANDIYFSGLLSGARGTFSGSVTVGSLTGSNGYLELQSGYLESRKVSGSIETRARLSSGGIDFSYFQNNAGYLTTLEQGPLGLEVTGSLYMAGSSFNDNSIRLAPYGPIIIDSSSQSQGNLLNNSRILNQYGAANLYSNLTVSGTLKATNSNTIASDIVYFDPSSSVTIGGNASRSFFVQRNAFFSNVLQSSTRAEFTGSVYFYGDKVNYNSEFTSGTTERGFCGVGGTAGGSSNIAGVGVNFRMKKTYTPSYVQLTPTSSTANSVQYTDVSNEGFYLYITKPNTTSTLYYFWRGYYYA